MMHTVIGLLRRAFLYGRGRPIAMLILLWTTTLSVVSELPTDPTVEELSGDITRPFRSARQFLFDSYQKYYPRQPLSQPVTIVAVDETSLARIGQWPWPRNKLAELIDAIDFYQPAAIGFDMYMPEADQTSPDQVADNLPPGAPAELATQLRLLPSHETRLAESLRSVPSILGAAGFDFTTYTSSAGLRTAPVSVSGGDALPYVRRFEAVLASLPELQAAARGQAILSVDLEFGVVRRIPLVVAIGDEIVSGLAMEMLRIATGSSAVEVAVGTHGIQSVSVADLQVPTQSGGEVWLHYAESSATAGRYVSAIDVLEGRADPTQLEGKLVMLGLTGSGLHDMRTTALSELVPGIEIQAQLLESLFDGRFVLCPWWMKWLEISCILAIGCFLVWFIPRTDSKLAHFLQSVPRASMWLTISLNILMITLGYLLFRASGLLFDASSCFIILSGVMGSLVSSAIIEIDRVAKDRDEQEQKIREAANLVAGRLITRIDNDAEANINTRSLRVARLTRALAGRAALDANFSAELTASAIDNISRVAPLRDAGIEALPADRWHDEPLSESELTLIAHYSEVADIAVAAARDKLEQDGLADTAEAKTYLRYFRDIVQSQHEWWNGEGYPKKMAGDEIPLAARILAVVDCYEDLIQDQSHRPALDHAAAMSFIHEAAGTQFDPRLVPYFDEVISSA